MNQHIAIFILVFLLSCKAWSYPIFTIPQPDPDIWKSKSPKVIRALDAYTNLRFKECLQILDLNHESLSLTSITDWYCMELQIFSYIQLGNSKKVNKLLDYLNQASPDTQFLIKKDLLNIVASLWQGQEDPRRPAKKIRNHMNEFQFNHSISPKFMILILLNQLAYFWGEERIKDMWKPLNKLERLLTKFYEVNHYLWIDYEIYKALLNSIEVDEQYKVLKPLRLILETKFQDSSAHNLMYANSIKAFSLIQNGRLTEGIRIISEKFESQEFSEQYSFSNLELGLYIGRLLWQTNRYSEAYTLAKKLHDLSKANHGIDSSTTIQYRILLARCMLRLRRQNESYDLANQSLQKLHLHPNSRLKARSHLVLSRLFMEQDRFIRAQRHLELGRQTALRHFSKNHSLNIEFQRLATTLKRLRNHSKKSINRDLNTKSIKL